MKIKDRIKQFGFFVTIKTTLYFLIRNILRVESYIVVIIANHKNESMDNRVAIINYEKINDWSKKQFIDKKETDRFLNFLDSSCKGYYIEVDKELAAWGFVETQGNYQYGKHIYQIPKNMHILKNLYVKPKFRGMSLGKYINEARVNDIPDLYIPCGFVVPENRYALRNLKMLGFQEYLKISHITWFKKFKKTKIKPIEKDEYTQLIIQGFKDE